LEKINFDEAWLGTSEALWFHACSRIRAECH